MKLIPFPTTYSRKWLQTPLITPERNWSQKCLQRRCLPKLTDSSVFILEPVCVDSLQLKIHKIHSFALSCPYFSLQEENYITLMTELSVLGDSWRVGVTGSPTRIKRFAVLLIFGSKTTWLRRGFILSLQMLKVLSWRSAANTDVLLLDRPVNLFLFKVLFGT